MRIYSIDQLEEQECLKLQQRLTEMELSASIENLFWLPVPSHMLTPMQKEHARECGPYVLALELTKESLHLELLVRAKNKMRCDCICSATPTLRNHMLDYIDALLLDLDIPA